MSRLLKRLVMPVTLVVASCESTLETAKKAVNNLCKPLVVATAVSALTMVGAGREALGGPIGIGDFGSNAIVQDYEGLGPPFSSFGPVVIAGEGNDRATTSISKQIGSYSFVDSEDLTLGRIWLYEILDRSQRGLVRVISQNQIKERVAQSVFFVRCQCSRLTVRAEFFVLRLGD